ncbi:serine protease FAM111A-like [Gastrophryne carolinensis]
MAIRGSTSQPRDAEDVTTAIDITMEARKKQRFDSLDKENFEMPMTSDHKNREEKSNTEQKNIKVEIESVRRVPVRFKWSRKANKGLTTINATPDTPIIDALKTNPKFSKNFKQTQNLIIHGNKIRAEINPSAPCGALAEGEELELSLKAKQVLETSPYLTYVEGLFIKVNKQGKTTGGQPRVILHYNNPKTNDTPLAVFGYKHQSVEEALHSDKRFKEFHSFSLQGTKGETFEMSVKLSLLPEDTYTVTDPIMVEDKTPGTDPQEANEPRYGVPTDQASNGRDTAHWVPTVTQAMTETIELLRNDFSEYIKANKGRISAWRLIKSNFSNNLQSSPLTVHIQKLLAQHSNSIGHIFASRNGDIQYTGTFFILCKSPHNTHLCLTCNHVVKDFLSPEYDIRVVFGYEHNNQSLKEHPNFPTQFLLQHENYDCAFFLVNTSMHPSCPDGLLEHIALPPDNDTVHIIGHPGGQCKQTDVQCSVISFRNRRDKITEAIERNPLFVNICSMYNFLEMPDPRLLTYKSGFYYGASGSPVFDKHGQLVAMHQGGYAVEGPRRETQSVLEFGRNTVDMIILGAVEIEELRIRFRDVVGRSELLQRYILHGSHPDRMQPNIRRLLEMWGVSAPANDSGLGDDSPMETS